MRWLVLIMSLGGCLDFDALGRLHQTDGDVSAPDGDAAPDLARCDDCVVLPDLGTAAECSEGTRDCVGNVPRRCSGGTWVNEAACAAPNPVCSSGACGPPCSSGQRDCSGNTPRLCDGQDWVVQPACSGTTPVCGGGACVECVEGENGCVADTPFRCVGGTKQFQPACSGATPKCSRGGCFACLDGARKCLSGVPQLCVGGEWQAQTACAPKGEYCSAGVCTSGCNSNSQCDANATCNTTLNKCVCSLGYLDCGGTCAKCSGTNPMSACCGSICVDLKTSLAHCGSCGNDCAQFATQKGLAPSQGYCVTGVCTAAVSVSGRASCSSVCSTKQMTCSVTTYFQSCVLSEGVGCTEYAVGGQACAVGDNHLLTSCGEVPPADTLCPTSGTGTPVRTTCACQ